MKKILSLTLALMLVLQSAVFVPAVAFAQGNDENEEYQEEILPEGAVDEQSQGASYTVTQTESVENTDTSASNPQPYPISVSYTLPNVVDTSANYLDFWSNTSPITTVVNPNGTLSICVVPNGSNIYIYELDANMQVSKTLTIPKELEDFGAFTKDPATGNYYIFYGQEVAEGDTYTENLCLAEYDADGNLTRSDFFTVRPTDPDGSAGVRVPFNASGCSMSISGDKLYVSFGREMHQTADGLNHQVSFGVVYDLNTFTQITTNNSWRSPWMSHVLEQVVIPIEDGFALLQKGDADPTRAFLLSEVTAGELQSTEIMQIEGESGNNYCYSEIGGLAKTSTGYIVVGTYERGVTDANTQADEHVDSRNLYVQTVSSDLQTFSEPVYLTNYTDKDAENAANPKMAPCGDGQYVILFEKLTSTGEYLGTYQIVVDEQGNVVSPLTQLPDYRLNMGAELVYNSATDSVFWTINSGGELVVYELDPNAPITVGTAEMTVNVTTPDGQPLEGATVTTNGQAFTANGATHTLELPYGPQELTISKPGYKTLTATVDNNGGTVVDATLGGAAVEVTVKDSDGFRVSGVNVTADGATVEETSPGWYTYVSSKPANSNFDMIFEKDGYITLNTTQSFDVQDGMYRVITMDDNTTVTFQVYDENQNPIPAFTVYFDGDMSNPYTSTNGSLIMPAFVAGSHTITVEAPGYHTYEGTCYINTYNQQVEIALVPDTVTEVPVSGVSLDQTSTTLEVGNTETLIASITPADATNQSVTWSSSDENVATVNSAGTVTAVSPGTTTITVTTNDGGFTDTCEVTVPATDVPVNGVTLDKTEMTLNVGETDVLTQTVSPQNATDKTVRWSSSDETVATVDDAGTVTAVSPGTTTITVTTNDGGFTDTCEVTVPATDVPVNGVTLDKTEMTLNVGETDVLTQTVSPTNATDKTVRWSSSDETVATVDDAGTVTAVASGTTMITATTNDGGFTDTCEVTVNDGVQPPIDIQVNDVTLDKTEMELKVGETDVLTQTVSPQNATDKTVRWSSSDETVATVSNTGTVTAIAPGTATITATTSNGKTDSCTVTVVASSSVDDDTSVPVDVTGNVPGVSVKGDSLPDNGKLEVKNETSSSKSQVQNIVDSATNLSSEYEVHSVYVFNLTDSSGNSVHNLDGTVTVTLPLPKELIGKEDQIVVLYIADDGTVAEMPTTVANGVIQFTTDHFSTYSIAVKSTDIAENTAVGENPTSGDNSNPTSWTVLMLGSALVLGAKLVSLRRSSGKTS